MTYHLDELEVKQNTVKGRIFRLVLLLVVVGAVMGVVLYRDTLLTRVNRVLASADEDPIPVASMERMAYQMEVPAYGEITGLESTPVPTPSVRSGSLKVAWLITEGSSVKAGDTVIRFDSTDARLNLETQQNTLDANWERTKITTGTQVTDEKVLKIDKTDAEEDYDYAMTVLPQDETIFSK